MRRAAIVLALVLGTSVAEAGKVKIPEQPVAYNLDAAWKAEAPADVPDAPVVVMRHEDGALLAVTVAPMTNSDAYRTKKRKAYLADIVDGFEATEGVDVDKQKVSKSGSTSIVDLWLTRGGEPVAVRVLVFRTKTVMVSVSGGSKKVRDAAIAAFKPT